MDIDFPSTSTSEEAPPVAAQADEARDVEPEDKEYNLIDSEKIVPSLEAKAPSAPPMLDDSEPGAGEVVVPRLEVKHETMAAVASLYPNLQEMRIKETAPAEVIRFPVEAMKPLSREQLAQLYRVDGEMGLAEAFEREFLTRELEENDQCMNHPLYQLLQRYAKARADLSLNVLEFEALRRKCKMLANELWTMREQTFTGTDTCGDGKVLRASYQWR